MALEQTKELTRGARREGTGDRQHFGKGTGVQVAEVASSVIKWQMRYKIDTFRAKAVATYIRLRQMGVNSALEEITA